MSTIKQGHIQGGHASNRSQSSEQVTTVTVLPKDTPLAQHFIALKIHVKAGKLYQRVATWFAEHRKACSDLDVRFKCEDSLKSCLNFTHLLTARAVMPNSEEHIQKSLRKVAVLTCG